MQTKKTRQNNRAPTWYLMCITAKIFAIRRATKTCVTVPGWTKATRLESHSFLELGLGSGLGLAVAVALELGPGLG